MATRFCASKTRRNDTSGAFAALQKRMAILLDCALVFVHCLCAGRAVFYGVICVSLVEFCLTRGCGENRTFFVVLGMFFDLRIEVIEWQ